MGIVLEYILDSYRKTDRYVLSTVDTKWNREKFRIRCGTNYLKKWDRWEAALSPEAQGIRQSSRRGATESTELFGYVVFYRRSETGQCL